MVHHKRCIIKKFLMIALLASCLGIHHAIPGNSSSIMKHHTNGPQHTTIKIVTAAELHKCLKKNEVLLIDVREPAEHRNERIEAAYLIPLSEITIDKLPSTEKPIVIHCASGRRSIDACAKLLKTSPSLDVSSLDGGIFAWRQAGYPTITYASV